MAALEKNVGSGHAIEDEPTRCNLHSGAIGV